MSEWAKTFLGFDVLLLLGAIFGIFVGHSLTSRIVSGVAALIFFSIAITILRRPQVMDK